MNKNVTLYIFFNFLLSPFLLYTNDKQEKFKIIEHLHELPLDIQHHIAGFVLLNSIKSWNPWDKSAQHRDELLKTALHVARTNPEFSYVIIDKILHNMELIRKNPNFFTHFFKEPFRKHKCYQDLYRYFTSKDYREMFDDRLTENRVLIDSVCYNNSFLVARKLREGYSPNIIDRSSRHTLLNIATKNGSLAIVNQLLAAGAYVDAQNPFNKQTPLMAAVQYHEYNIARSLLEHQADPNAQDHQQKMPFQRAHGQRMKQLLVRYGSAIPHCLACRNRYLHQLQPEQTPPKLQKRPKNNFYQQQKIFS